MFYEEPFDFEEKFDYRVEMMRENRDTAAKGLQDILEILYGFQHLDLFQLEWHLDELCYTLGVKMNVGELNIERKIQ